jgi:hypothetical protein
MARPTAASGEPVTTIVLFTGSRERGRSAEDHAAVSAVLDALQPGDYVIHGAAPGLDSTADHLARGHRTPLLVLCMPYVHALGARGGPYRNAAMVTVTVALRDALEAAVTVHAFPPRHSRSGTRDCMRRAADRRLMVITHELPEVQWT